MSSPVSDPVIQKILENPPKEIELDFWCNLNVGEQLRYLKNSHYLYSIPVDQHESIIRLPDWLRYGPENGAPIEWFSTIGLLLPKYQPGGGLHGDVLFWRRQFRCRQNIAEKAEIRVQDFIKDNGTISLILILTSFCVFAITIDLPVWIASLIIFLIQFIGMCVAPGLLKYVYSRCLSRKLRIRLLTEPRESDALIVK